MSAAPKNFTSEFFKNFSGDISEQIRKESSFERSYDAAFCAVRDGKTIFISKDFFESSGSLPLVLGRSGAALTSLAALEMLSQKKLPKNSLSKWTDRAGEKGERTSASSICSLFKCPNSDATLADLFDMRASISPGLDSLIPKNASPEELFSLIASSSESYPSSGRFGRGDFSSSSISAASLILAYSETKKTQNLGRIFRERILKKYLFSPLGMSEARFVSIFPHIDGVSKALEPAYAAALSIEDTAKWLECETSESPKLSSRELIAARRNAAYPLPFPERVSKENFSGGWLAAFDGEFDFFIVSDSFRACANIVAIFPKYNMAVALFVFERKHANSDSGRTFEQRNADAARIASSCFKVFLNRLSQNLK